MSEETDKLASMQTQNLASGAKATNVIMHNQQAQVMEYVSEAYIPEEIQQAFPLQTMMIMKRAIGNETEWESACNDIEYDMTDQIIQIAGEETGIPIALSYLHHREGLRARGMSERIAQVTQRTIETLNTNTASERKGFFEKIGGFVKGADKKPSNPLMSGAK